jgi:hypothetical protein
MISLRWDNNMQAEIAAMMDRYKSLPKWIAKKHLMAAMRRTLKDGVPMLRAVTPPVGVRRGRLRKGEKRTTGALRRSVTTKAKYVGRNADGAVYGVIGYRAGMESRKALWLEFGTKRVEPRRIVAAFLQRYGGPSLSRLKAEMASAFEAAGREVASGKNPGSPF